MIDRPITEIAPDEGFSFTAPAGSSVVPPELGPVAVVLLEDGVPMSGPRHGRLGSIRTRGRGRYSLWHGYLYFSSSDNSDPRTNGRSYMIRIDDRRRSLAAKVLSRLMRVQPAQLLWGALYWSGFALLRIRAALNLRKLRIRVATLVKGAVPVNMQRRAVSSAKVAEDVAYALKVGEGYLQLLAARDGSLKDSTVLEIGPGINFGSVLLFACFGAKPMVADRFLAQWAPEYHSRFYSLFRDAVKNRFPDADLAPLDRIVAQGSYERVIERFACALEDLKGVPDAGVDIVFSNAVLEHVYDPRAATASLARITKPGGLGLHQIDFRYHKSMDRPLDFLLTPDAAFDREFRECHGECGNRLRPFEYVGLFEFAGFEVTSSSDMSVDEAYLHDFMPRLRAAAGSRYRDARADDLRPISVMIRAVRR